MNNLYLSELQNKLVEREEEILKQLKVKVLDRCNRVVVSDNHFIAEKNGRTDVQVLSVFAEPVRLTEKLANKIAQEDEAYYGDGKRIVWIVKTERDFLLDQLRQIRELGGVLLGAAIKMQQQTQNA